MHAFKKSLDFLSQLLKIVQREHHFSNCHLPKVSMNKYHVMINGINLLDQSFKNNKINI